MVEVNKCLSDFYKDRKILITGAGGTIGKEVIRQLMHLQPAFMRLMDNNETEMFFLMEKYKNSNVTSFLGDVRDYEKLKTLTADIDIVIHTAAFKHVILSEYNPFDAVQTNVIGVENVIRAASANNVKYVLFTSSDKAVNPTNVMGTSKLMSERLITAANAVKCNQETIFSSTRFGNVLGSRGSVVPIFMKQIKKGGPVTLTDSRMTRFVMTVEEAVMLVLSSVQIARGGEVFVTKMPVVYIKDLAEVMIELLAPPYGYKVSDIKMTEIGVKAGEKIYEELMTEEEMHRSLELKDMFVIIPAFKSIYQSIDYNYESVLSKGLNRSYVSLNEKPFSKDEIKDYLIRNRVLDRIEKTFMEGDI